MILFYLSKENLEIIANLMLILIWCDILLLCGWFWTALFFQQYKGHFLKQGIKWSSLLLLLKRRHTIVFISWLGPWSNVVKSLPYIG